MKNLIDHVKESLLDGEDELMDRVKLIPLMKLAEARDKNDYNNILGKFVNQFKVFEKNKIYLKGRYYDFSEANNDDLLICFETGNLVKIGYKDIRKASIVIFYSDSEDEIVVSVGAPFTQLAISNFNNGVYKLPPAYKEDFEKIVEKYQGNRKKRIL